MNYNLFFGHNFKLVIPKNPEVNYFLQTCSVPGVSMGPTDTPFRNNEAFMPGNVVQKQNLSVSIILDEDLETYVSIYNWLTSFIDQDVWRNLTQDIQIHVLSSNKRVNKTFTFVQAFPVTIGEIPFDSTVNESTQVAFTCDFRFQYFTF